MSNLNIVTFGDSNTYGYTPTGSRYSERYGNVIGKYLDSTIYEEGVVGRTTIYSDRREGRCAIQNVKSILSSYKSVDYLIVMLGTNDYKQENARSLSELKSAMTQILNEIKSLGNIKKLILVSPITLAENIEELDHEFDHKSYELSKEASKVYQELSKEYEALFLDAKLFAYPGEDGEHFTKEGHYALGYALAQVIQNDLVSCYN